MSMYTRRVLQLVTAGILCDGVTCVPIWRVDGYVRWGLLGSWIYIDRNDSRLRTERMHHKTRQKQVHATTTHLLTSTSRGSVA